jgi:hypothetical protein
MQLHHSQQLLQGSAQLEQLQWGSNSPAPAATPSEDFSLQQQPQQNWGQVQHAITWGGASTQQQQQQQQEARRASWPSDVQFQQQHPVLAQQRQLQPQILTAYQHTQQQQDHVQQQQQAQQQEQQQALLEQQQQQQQPDGAAFVTPLPSAQQRSRSQGTPPAAVLATSPCSAPGHFSATPPGLSPMPSGMYQWPAGFFSPASCWSMPTAEQFAAMSAAAAAHSTVSCSSGSMGMFNVVKKYKRAKALLQVGCWGQSVVQWAVLAVSHICCRFGFHCILRAA